MIADAHSILNTLKYHFCQLLNVGRINYVRLKYMQLRH